MSTSGTEQPLLRHITPAFRTFCGQGSLDALPRELARHKASRAVLVCSPSVLRHPHALQGVHDALGGLVAGVFSDVGEHSPLPAVDAARQYLADREADAVIAVGGGSAVVTARAASILLAEDRPVRELCTHRGPDGRLISPRLNAPKLPQWVVPTTPTTAYAKAGSAVRDPETGERLALFDPATRAQGIVVDPAMALTAPVGLAWSASLDAFSMAVEGLQSPAEDPLADALLAHALRTVERWLPRLREHPDDPRPRTQLMLAALMSGQGSDHTGGGLAQALSHSVGPRSSTANGVAEALLLPHALRFNTAQGNPSPRLAEALGVSKPAEPEIGTRLERLLETFQVPARLRDIGVAGDALPGIAAHAMEDWAISNAPRPPTREQTQELLDAAW